MTTQKLLIIADVNVKADHRSFGLGQFCKLANETLQKVNDAIASNQGAPPLPVLEALVIDGFSPGDLAKALTNDEVRACMLFGHDGIGEANDADVESFERFITQRKGRCFATGDHEKLGANISGRLLGFNTIRLWQGPGIGHSEALNTRVRPRAAEVDAHPKPVFSNWSWAPDRRVHPIADYQPNLPICFLPDHGHEGGFHLDAPLEEGWSSHDVMHAVIRIKTEKSEYTPEVVPIVRVLDHFSGSRLIADSTIHHWLNESWIALASTDAIDQVRAYAQNILIQLLPNEHLEAVAITALQLVNANSRLREITDRRLLGAYINAIAAREDLFLWRVLRAWKPRPEAPAEDDGEFSVTAFGNKKNWIEILGKGEARDYPSFEEDLGAALIRYRRGQH